MKFALSFFTVLLIVVGAMLFVQYQVYSDYEKSSSSTYSYSQEIEVAYRDGNLLVSHQFKNLPNDKVTINWPQSAAKPSCLVEGENSCDRLSADLQTFSEGETTTQSITYEIPLQNGLQNGKIINDIFATLNKGKVAYTTIHIATPSSIGGQWVSGLPLVGKQSLQLVNYTMFSGKGSVNELYWQQAGIALQSKEDKVSFYGSNSVTKDALALIGKIPLLNEDHIALIQGSNSEQASSGRIVFIPELTSEALKNNVLFSQVLSLYNFGDSPQWFKQVVASLLTKQSYGNEKPQQIVETINNELTEEQLLLLDEKLESLQHHKISVTVLDDTLSEILGDYTRYLTMNSRTDEIYPFLFSDQREIFVGDVKQKDIQVVFKDGQVLYSAQSLLKALGYEANVGDHGYYVKNATRQFRFPNEHGFYVFNQRRYNTVSEPFVQIAGEYYLEETWLQRLFVVEVKKLEERITIVTTTQQ